MSCVGLTRFLSSKIQFGDSRHHFFRYLRDLDLASTKGLSGQVDMNFVKVA